MRNFFLFFFGSFFFISVSQAQSVGGAVNPANTIVCSGTNSGLLTLSGHSGSVVRWQSSTSNGASWTNISNTTVNLVYSNLTTTTWYRAEVLLSPSPPNISAFSTPGIVTVDAPSSGAVNASTSVCSGINSGTLSLSGTFTYVAHWDSSTDGGSNWISIANTTANQDYSNLTTTTLYRASVTNGTCAAANASAAIITVNPVTVGGTVLGTATVCAGSNSGTLTLNGYVGNVIRWQSSTDGGASWTNISNTNAIHNFSNITQSTEYRAVVQSGNCTIENSSSVMITVSPASDGGTISSPASVCSGANNGTLLLNGHTGTILRWENSVNDGSNWMPIVNTTNTYSYNNLTASTVYRAVVKSGGCALANSAPVLISVSSASVGGLVSGTDSACSGSNSGILILNGYSGNIVRWQSSTDEGATWTTISNTSPFYNYSNVTTTTDYRAIVQNGACPTANSSKATLTIFPISLGGNLSPATYSVCHGMNNGTIVLNGQSGNILNWESSIDGGITWIPIANATTTQNFHNLTVTTLYRAIVKQGQCASDYSAVSTISVSPVTAGGTIFGNDTVCTGTNNGTLALNGYTGNILNWEYSKNAGVTWSSISNTSPIYNYTNLTATTIYRAIVQSGSCATSNSANATITVSPATVGGSVFSNNFVCDSTTSGLLTLSGFTGSIVNWEYSTNGGNTWVVIANTTNTQTYSGITAETIYKAVVQSGACSSAASTPASISLAIPIIASYSSVTNAATVIFTNTSSSNSGESFWNFGDATTSTIVSPAHTYTANGTYSVTLIVSDSCGADTIVQTVFIAGVGMNELAYNNPDVVIYPNPFSEEAVLDIKDSGIGIKDFKMQIYNIFGEMILQSQILNRKSLIKRSGLPSGIYFYKLFSKNEIIALGKIVIQ